MAHVKVAVDPNAPRGRTPPGATRRTRRERDGTIRQHFIWGRSGPPPQPEPEVDEGHDDESDDFISGAEPDDDDSFKVITDPSYEDPAEVPLPPQPVELVPRDSRTPSNKTPSPKTTPRNSPAKSATPHKSPTPRKSPPPPKSPTPTPANSKSPTPGPSRPPGPTNTGIKRPSSPDGSSSGGTINDPPPSPPTPGIMGPRVTRSKPGKLYGLDMDGAGAEAGGGGEGDDATAGIGGW
ncbi:hypothetical protein MMC13_006932 [Lambiella insularis]|nr:hypothetical protein [Lambiella insularis]